MLKQRHLDMFDCDRINRELRKIGIISISSRHHYLYNNYDISIEVEKLDYLIEKYHCSLNSIYKMYIKQMNLNNI